MVTLTLPFLHIFNGRLFGWILWMYGPNLKSVGLFIRSCDNDRGYLKTLGSPCIRHSRSSNVSDFGTSRKGVYDVLLFRNSNLGPILHRFGRGIAGFLSCWVTPPLFNPNFGGVPVAIDRPCWGSARAEALIYSAVKLFAKIPTYVITIPERNRRTDRRTIYRAVKILPNTCNNSSRICYTVI